MPKGVKGFKKADPNINRNGRPPVESSWTGILKEITEESVKAGDKNMTRKEVIARRLVSEAAKGESWAIKALMDRMDGTPRQSLDVDHSGTMHLNFDREDSAL